MLSKQSVNDVDINLKKDIDSPPVARPCSYMMQEVFLLTNTPRTQLQCIHVVDKTRVYNKY